MRKLTKRPLLFLVSAGCLLTGLGLGSGAAYAYFTASGSGSGPASVATLTNVTVTAATGTVTAKLLPGGTGDVTLTVSNQNSFQVTLVKVVANGPVTADSSHSSCTATGVTFNPPSSLNTTIASNGTTTVTLPNAASMSTASSPGCQGAQFSVPVTITVQK